MSPLAEDESEWSTANPLSTELIKYRNFCGPSIGFAPYINLVGSGQKSQSIAITFCQLQYGLSPVVPFVMQNFEQRFDCSSPSRILPGALVSSQGLTLLLHVSSNSKASNSIVLTVTTFLRNDCHLRSSAVVLKTKNPMRIVVITTASFALSRGIDVLPSQ